MTGNLLTKLLTHITTEKKIHDDLEQVVDGILPAEVTDISVASQEIQTLLATGISAGTIAAMDGGVVTAATTAAAPLRRRYRDCICL